MIVCTQCGFQNLDEDSFCGSCGGFLEWTGEKSAPPAAEIPDEDDPAPKRSLRSRVQTILSLDVYAPGEEPPPVPQTPGRPGVGPPGVAGGPPRPGGGPPPGVGSRPPGPGSNPPGVGSRPPGPGTNPPGPASNPPGIGTRPPGPGTNPPGIGTRPPGPGTNPPGIGTRPPGPGTNPPGPASNPPGPGDATAGGENEVPTEPEPSATVGQDAAGLVARNATASTPPAAPSAPPRPVARTTVGSGEATIGAPQQRSATAPSKPATGPVVPVKPAPRGNRPKPTKQAPVRKPLPGDLVCGECGEGNPPARNFCSRCGNTLRDATVAKRRWWQRLVPRRRRKALAAGTRPWKASDGSQKQRRNGGKLLTVYAKARPIVAGLLLVAGLLVGFSPNLRDKATGKISDVKNSLMSRVQPTYVPLSPIDIAGTSADPDQPVTNVIDGNPLSFWVAPGTDREPTLVVRFDQPFDLHRIQIWNGAATGFKDHERIRDLHFVFDTGQSFDLEVKDLPDGEEYDIDNAKGVREIEIHVVGTYSSLTSDDLGLSEIEFYFRE